MSYEVSDLQVLTPSAHVRKRPGMYVGETENPSPIFNEVFDNAIDEVSAGYSDVAQILMDYVENECTIIDHGRGFPQGTLDDPNTGKKTEAVELLCTTPFSGGKFGGGGYKLSCFTGDTKIKLADGRDLSIEDLIKEYESGVDNFCYSVDNESGKFLIEKIRDVRVARYVKDLCEVSLDNGEKVRCTPDHKFLLRDGSLKKAEDLKSGDSLLPGYFRKSNGNEFKVRAGYDLIYDQSLGEYVPCHYLADEYNLRNGVYSWLGQGLCRHHKDFNKNNNNPTNIVQLTWEDHFREHGKVGRDLLIKYNQSEKGRETSRKVGQTVGSQNFLGYVLSDEGRQYHSELMTSLNKDPETKLKQQAWMHTEEGRQSMSLRAKSLNSSTDHQLKCRKGKILKVASRILSEGKEISPETWEEFKGVKSPRYSIAITYFKDLQDLTEQARLYNHKVVSVSHITLDQEVPVYDLTVREGADNFLLSAGIFVKNCGLNGVGNLVTNSLSEEMEVKTWRDNRVVDLKMSKGETQSVEYVEGEEEMMNLLLDLSDVYGIDTAEARESYSRRKSGDNVTLEEVCSKNDVLSASGTCVRFKPDPECWTTTTIPQSHIEMRCKVASAFGMKTKLRVKDKDSLTFKDVDVTADTFDLLPTEDDGVSEYYRHSFKVLDPSTGEYAVVALKYTSDTKSYYRGYTNLLYNSQGGTHIKMLESAIYDAWSKFNIPDIKWNDIYLGLRGVVAVFISHTEFSSQSKERLTVNKSYLESLRLMIVDEIVKWLTDNPDIKDSLIKRFQEYRAAQNRLLARKEIKSLLYINESKGGQVRRQSVVRKLRECSSKTREDTELWICEGDSAAGTILAARDIRLQSVLPVRGKVLNVARLEDLGNALKNEEIRSIINSIGAGIGETADPDKSRYDRIIFCTDADADGKEIATLLSGIFINLLPELVKSGMVYTALPPLYGWKDKKGVNHFADLRSQIPESVKEFHRYKGLGECDPDEMWDSCLNPDTRRLVKINYPDDLGLFNSILTSSSVKYQMLVDQGVIK